MVVRRHLVAFMAAAVILVRLATPAAASPEPAAPEMEQFVDEVSSALGPFAPVLAEAFSAAAGDGEVWAAHVHPAQSKPYALELVQWFQGQLPTVKVLFNDLNRDLDPVRAELNAALAANSEWLRGELTTILPIVFNIVCTVGDDVLSPFICDLLINVLPGLATSFWPIIMAFAPTILGLGGDFLPAILNFLIGILSSAPATAAVSNVGRAASDVEAAHLHTDILGPHITALLRWIGEALTDPALSLLPILQAIAPVLGDVLIDVGRILDWLSSQIGTIMDPIIELVCIVADDIGIVNLGCALKSLITSMATNVIEGVIGTIRDWVNQLPSRLGTTTTTTSSITTTTTTRCFIFCSASVSAASADSGSGGGGELPMTGAVLPLGLLGMAISAMAGALWVFRRRVSAAGA